MEGAVHGVVESLSLEVFKSHVDVALRDGQWAWCDGLGVGLGVARTSRLSSSEDAGRPGRLPVALAAE